MLYYLTGNTFIFSALLGTNRKFLHRLRQNGAQEPERRLAHCDCLLVRDQVSEASEAGTVGLTGRTCKLRLILLLPSRTSFQQFLRRPDHKQEFVSQWQADFNSLPEDLWDDEETKAEVHQRVNVRESLTGWASSPHSPTLRNPNPFPLRLPWGVRARREVAWRLTFKSDYGKAHWEVGVWANSVWKPLSEPCRHLGRECICHRGKQRQRQARKWGARGVFEERQRGRCGRHRVSMGQRGWWGGQRAPRRPIIWGLEGHY